jgi:hypothetical protein
MLITSMSRAFPSDSNEDETMNILTRKLTGALAVGALMLGSIAPAIAQDRGPGGGDRGRGGGSDAGGILAGVLVLGGIAAVAAAAGSNRGDRDYAYGRAGYRGQYGREGHGYGNPNDAVRQCARTAEREARRASYGRADVTGVQNVSQTRYGYEVRGRIAVNGSNGRGWRDGDDRYDRQWNDDRYGYDSGSFRCRVEGGRVVDLDFSGVRGL